MFLYRLHRWVMIVLPVILAVKIALRIDYGFGWNGTPMAWVAGALGGISYLIISIVSLRMAAYTTELFFGERCTVREAFDVP
jgi:hypothetical protein